MPLFIKDCLLTVKEERITAVPYIRKKIHLKYYAGYFNSCLATFRDNQSVPSCNFKQLKKCFPSPKVMQSKNSTWTVWTSGRSTKNCPETSVQNYEITLHSIPEEQRALLHGCGSLVFRICINANVFWWDFARTGYNKIWWASAFVIIYACKQSNVSTVPWVC